MCLRDFKVEWGVVERWFLFYGLGEKKVIRVGRGGSLVI